MMKKKYFECYQGVIRLKFSPETAAAKSLQSCLTLCDPIDISSPGSPVPGEPHEQRSLMGYSPWGCKELYMTEAP